MTLHLILKAQWYCMIEQGIKKEEYREINPYWVKRFINNTDARRYWEYFYEGDPPYFLYLIRRALAEGQLRPYDKVTFHYGYSSRTMTFEIENIHIGRGVMDWGAEKNTEYFVIKLGERVKELL